LDHECVTELEFAEEEKLLLKEIQQVNQYIELLSFMLLCQYKKLINCENILHLSRVGRILRNCTTRKHDDTKGFVMFVGQ
jgi:hypothetical protein